MKNLLLFAGLLMLAGCAGLSDGGRKASCALDEYCVQTPLCDNLDGLNRKQVEEKFDAYGEEQEIQNVSANNPGQWKNYHYQKSFQGQSLTLIADLIFKQEDSKGDYFLTRVQRCELRKPNREMQNYMRGVVNNRINKIQSERN